MFTVLLTATGSPAKGGTEAERKARAMHPPVAVPAKGGPETFAVVTRPDGAKVTCTRVVPLGSPGCLQPAAVATAVAKAAAAASLSNSCVGAAVVEALTEVALAVADGALTGEALRTSTAFAAFA